MQTEVLVFPDEFELHYVRGEKLVLRIDIPFETDVSSMEIFGYDFKFLPGAETASIREIRRALKEAASSSKKADKKQSSEE